MKNIAVTVIVGFVTGLIISGILFDAINYFGKSFNRVSVSWNISKAEKAYSEGRFSDSVSIYKKILSKIGTDNKLLTAKTKNNTALSIIKKIETDDEELNAFLFSLGCYEGEPITVISHLRGSCTVSIKDGRYTIDRQLAEAITVF